MGSSLSKSKKKNRKSVPSGISSQPPPQQQQQQQGRRARPASEAAVSQNPPQWSQTNRHPAIQGEGSAHYSLMNNYDQNDIYQGRGEANTKNKKKSPRNSGNDTPQHNNMAQPRTSISNGRPSFSLLRGRKSTQIQREEDYQPILHISAPIIEPVVTTGSSNYSRDANYNTISTEQPAPPRTYRPRPSLDVNRYQQQMNGYVEPPRAPNAGAYKAPVPALPPSVVAQIASLPPPPQISTPPLPTLDTASFPFPPAASSSQTSSQEPQRLWRESLRNAAAVEGRKVPDSGLVRSNSNASYSSHASQSSSTFSPRGYKKNQPISGSTFATTVSATTLSPSTSNASQSSFGMSRQRSLRTNNSIHPESPQSRPQRHFMYQDRIDNASVISLPGSRFRGDGGASDSVGTGGENDDNISSPVDGSTIGSPRVQQYQHHQQFPFPPGSPSLVGVNTQNNRYGSQFSSPRQSTASMTPSQRWSQTGALLQDQQQQQQQQHHPDGLNSPVSSNRSRPRTANSSARASMASISTANYQWMEEQHGDNSGSQDAMHRDSVLMLFNHNNTNQSPAAMDFSASTTSPTKPPLLFSPNLPSPEQMAQQLQEQQTQQHALLKYFFKGNYRAPVNKDDLGSVLDVGCGGGLWMKDMALEFPLTEIHGIDLVIPTRRRRPRVAASLQSQDRKMDPQTSTQSTGSSSYRSSNPPMTSSQGGSAAAAMATAPPTMLDSMPSNCFFHKGDITQGLPFADNTFDYCHVRFVLWGYTLNGFPDLLTELVRVTKRDGWIEFVDMDPCIKKANEPGLRINEWIKTGLIHSNMDPDLVKTLPKFLREYCEATAQATAPRELVLDPTNKKESISLPSAPYGLDHLKVSKISLPFGAWGGQVGELWQQSFTSFLKELEPMMMDATLSGLVMDQYHRQCQQELQELVESSSQMHRMSFESSLQGRQQQEPSKITSFDQRLCTHKAWNHLIQQLVRDANLSTSDPMHDVASSSSSSTPFSRAPGSSPLQNSTMVNGSSPLASPSIKEMRSYNNIYIIYAQKVDLEELKQQQLFKHLEDEVLSPNPNHSAPATFGSTMENTMSMEQVFDQVKQLQSSKDDLNKRTSTASVQESQVLSGVQGSGSEVVAPMTKEEEPHGRLSEEVEDTAVLAQSIVQVPEQDESYQQIPQYIELEAESSDEEIKNGEHADDANTIKILNRVSLEDFRPPSIISLQEQSQQQQQQQQQQPEVEAEVDEDSLQMLNVSDEGNDDLDDENDDKEEVLVMLAPESPKSPKIQYADSLDQVLSMPMQTVEVEASHAIPEEVPVEEQKVEEQVVVGVPTETKDAISNSVPQVEEAERMTLSGAVDEVEQKEMTEKVPVENSEIDEEGEDEEPEAELESKSTTAANTDDDEASMAKGVATNIDGSLNELQRQKKLKKKSKSKKRRSRFL
ncbi:hypothetical protein BGZ83_000374 [Gryganskiella cystojenkinii]|nr:hypothetical protein BGZ83_000374 [Gryganskiella cystojenkinii]